MDLVRKDTERTYKNVVKQIQSLIQEGVLAPGDQLLSERQLSEKLGVSRTTLREALTALEALGVIQMGVGGRATIKKASVVEVVESLASFIVREKESIFDLLEVRSIFEVRVAELAAIRASELAITNLKNFLSQLEHDIKQGNNTDESDPRFHFAVAEAANNPLLLEVMGVINGLMKQPFTNTRESLLSKQPEVLLSQHHKLVRAIEKHDPVLARSAVQEVLAMVEQELIASGWSEADS